MLVVEGELNAIAVWLALEGQADVVGMPGVEGRIPRASLQGRRVYLLADGDEADREALKRWQREIEATPLAPLPEGLDPCEWAERYGLRGLGEALRKGWEDGDSACTGVGEGR
ncbi:MAG: hypothetical protein C4331_19205 [Meiothermus sp.]